MHKYSLIHQMYFELLLFAGHCLEGLRIQQETKETSMKTILGRGNNSCKGHEAGPCLECWRNSEAGASKFREPLTETAHLGQAQW